MVWIVIKFPPTMGCRKEMYTIPAFTQIVLTGEPILLSNCLLPVGGGGQGRPVTPGEDSDYLSDDLHD